MPSEEPTSRTSASPRPEAATADPGQRPALAFGTPRKLPKAARLKGRVVVLDIAFAGAGSGGFDKITLPLIRGLGERLVAWVDHHDHDEHRRFRDDPRFVLSTKAEHGACPEMVTPELVERAGPVETIVCHTDFDGLASAAKWIRGGSQPYPECDADARAVDTRIGSPGPVGKLMDRALRARPRDTSLFHDIIDHLVGGLQDAALQQRIEADASELVPIERATERAARTYQRVSPEVAIVDVSVGFGAIDKTLLLLKGQELQRVSVVLDERNVSVAAGFDSGLNFLELFDLPGGMPTRVSLPRSRLRFVLHRLGLSRADVERFS